MKKQTWLKFLLCFLIITGTVGMQEVNAATKCNSCGLDTVENGKCVWRNNQTGEVTEYELIKVGEKYYHKSNKPCATCDSYSLYIERFVDKTNDNLNTHKCTNGGNVTNYGGSYCHELSKLCQTCNLPLGSKDGGYVCKTSTNLIEDSKGNIAHKVGSCGTCNSRNAQIGNYNGIYKCINREEITECVSAGTYYFHKIGACKDCEGNIYKEADGTYGCTKGSVANADRKHTTSNGCECGGTVENFICTNGNTKNDVVAYKYKYYHVLGKCVTNGTVIQFNGSYYCVTDDEKVALQDGKYYHVSNVCIDNGQTAYVDGKLRCIDHNCDAIRIGTTTYHLFGKCERNKEVYKDSNGLRCACVPAYIVQKSGDKYVHKTLVTPVGGYQQGNNQVVTGGPSANAFFNAANKDEVKNAFGVIDDNLDPVLHIQSLIMMIGVYIAVIVVLIYGIQWLMATPSKRQELKAGLWPLVIGVILLVIGPKLAIMIVNALLGIG